MSDELKPQSIDSPEFRALLRAHNLAVQARFTRHATSDAVQAERSMRAALIAHIDAWGARLAEDMARDSARLERFIDWYFREGKRMEIDPYGHIRVTTREHLLNWLDGGSNEITAAPTPEKEDA